jgi:hypothetical protein
MKKLSKAKVNYRKHERIVMNRTNRRKNKESIGRGVRRMAKDHEHQWVYDGKGCCYRLRCAVPGCLRLTTAYRFMGNRDQLTIGTPVQFLENDKEAIEVIGSTL